MLKKYQDIIDNLDRISTTLDNSLELKEARGDKITEEDYQRPLEVANEQIDNLYDKREQLLKKQAIYDVGSDLYDDIAEQIADIDDDIYGLLIDIEDIKDKIWEIRWEPFFEGQEALENLRGEMDDMRDLLNDDAFIGEKGGLTAEGITNIALISSAMNQAKQGIRNYQEALKKLDEDLKNGNISTSEYEEQQKDFLDQIRESVGVVEDYKDSIVDLWTEMIEKENDIIKESIDKHKELKKEKKDNDDYSRNVRDQQKDINAIQAQISALSGVNNESAKAELKRLQSELKSEQESLKQLQKDREYEIRQQGYEGLSDDLNDALEDTLNEVKYNADKQEAVISEMLNHVVQNYQTAYDKINSIIANTGFTPSGDFQQSIGNLGTSQGAQNQVDDSNTIAPEYTPDDFAGGINTGPIQSESDQANNDRIEAEIEKEPNITNRPVAQITLKPTSISLQEGKSSKISVSIRPTDAANKSVQWSSSNTSVATVSSGTVKAVKPGSAKITCTALDGSGVSASCSVTVTAKPKPAPKPSASSSGGDGVIRVGDRVKYVKGKYYYSSDGLRPTGSQMLGQWVYVGKINNRSWANKPYALYRDKKFTRPLGWVSKSQLSGYVTGTRKITSDLEFASINEAGNELVIRRGGRDYTTLQYGDGVVPANLTNNIFTLAQHTNEIMDKLRNGGGNTELTVENHYGSLLTVNGNVDKEALPGLEEILEKSYQNTVKRLYRDAELMGMRRKL